jgi:DNA polymerase III alpha subunit
MDSDVEDSPPVGRFVHLDVLTAHSPWCSPSTPEHYVQALARQYRIGPNTDGQPRPALAIADYGPHSAVKTAIACQRAGLEHIVGLRVRVVPERGKRTFFVFFHPNGGRRSRKSRRLLSS